MNALESAACLIQAEWRTAQIQDKLKLMQRADKLGRDFVQKYETTEDLMNMMKLFMDRELKISFLKGFESTMAGGVPVSEDTKTFLHYEMLRNKRSA